MATLTQQEAVKTLSQGLFTALAPAVQSCDDRLTRLETSQDILMNKMIILEEQLVNLKNTHDQQKSKLPLLKKRTAQLENIRRRITRLHSMMNIIATRVQNTEQKLLSLPSSSSTSTTTTTLYKNSDTNNNMEEAKEKVSNNDMNEKNDMDDVDEI
jgi:hypothetical protein